MIKRVAMLTALGTCLLVPHGASAAEATAQEAGKELGAILAWRLGPEAIEERCRAADPEGAQVRKEALNAWMAKNDLLIKAVDSRVAAIIPQIQRASPGADPVLAVREQVRQIFLESVFAEKSPEESAALCKSEANPAHPRWNHNGLPHVRQSLAALDDWEIRRNSK
jgi:hypothetical protein